jgi:hypothetical protein
MHQPPSGRVSFPLIGKQRGDAREAEQGTCGSHHPGVPGCHPFPSSDTPIATNGRKVRRSDQASAKGTARPCRWFLAWRPASREISVTTTATAPKAMTIQARTSMNTDIAAPAVTSRKKAC